MPEPFRVLTADPADPMTDEERAAETQRSGPRRDAIPPPALDALTESTAQLLRRELALTRESLPTVPTVSGPAVSEPPKSRAAAGAKLTLNVGKYTALVVGALGIAAQIAHIWRPDLEGPLQTVLKLFGAP